MSTQIDWLLGRSLLSLHRDAEADQWVFDFGGGHVLQVSSPWRLVANGGIALGHGDDGEQFGLPEVIDTPRRVLEVVKDRSVEDATAASGTADLTIDFGDGVRLEVFNDSVAYEGWMLNTSEGHWLVAQGGGRLVTSTSE